MAIIIIKIIFVSFSNAQKVVTISGTIKDKKTKATIPFANVVLKSEHDSIFIEGTVTNDDGRFSLSKII